MKGVAFFKKLHAEKFNNPLWKPQFVFSSNNVNKIINNVDDDSELSSRIEWITINPGRQSIGSFHPTDRNFFKGMFSSPILLLILSEKPLTLYSVHNASRCIFSITSTKA